MSIAAHIIQLESAGKLRRHVGANSPLPSRRRLFLAEPAMKDLDDPSSPINILVGKGSITAALTYWTTNGRVYGTRKGGKFLKRLLPPSAEVWEIMVRNPEPQVRLFGRFAEPDTLILTKFHTRNYLKLKESLAWKEAITHCSSVWDELFPGIPPFKSNSVHDYITEKCDDFPI